LIEAYFRSLLAAIEASSIARASNVTLDKRTPQAALIRGDVFFADGSRLHFRELVELQAQVIRRMYSFHYQDADDYLIFRYDDTQHHPRLTSFPHHKHNGREQDVIDAAPPDLIAVLHEIESIHPTNH
jgi:hypothetical protein